jgi:hypothetical protein
MQNKQPSKNPNKNFPIKMDKLIKLVILRLAIQTLATAWKIPLQFPLKLLPNPKRRMFIRNEGICDSVPQRPDRTERVLSIPVGNRLWVGGIILAGQWVVG